MGLSVTDGRGRFFTSLDETFTWSGDGDDGMVILQNTDRLYNYLPGNAPKQPVESVLVLVSMFPYCVEERIDAPPRLAAVKKFTGVGDIGYYDETKGTRVHYTTPVTRRWMSEWQQISLADSLDFSVIASHHKARWKFRVSNAIDRPLGYQDAHYVQHNYITYSQWPYALPVYAECESSDEWPFQEYIHMGHYGWYLDEEQGWYAAPSREVTEYAYFGGRVDDRFWRITYLGDGRATFAGSEPSNDDALVETDFGIEADTWYILEYEVEEVTVDEVTTYYADYRLSYAENGEPGGSVAHVRWETLTPYVDPGRCGEGEATEEDDYNALLYAPGADFTWLDEYRYIVINGAQFLLLNVYDSENLRFYGPGAGATAGPVSWRLQRRSPFMLDVSAEVNLLFGGELTIEYDWIKVWGETGQSGSGQEGELVYPTPGEAEMHEGWTTEMCFVIGSRFTISNSAVMDTLNVYNTGGMLLERNVDWIPDPDDETGRAFLITAYPFLTVECTYLNLPPMLPYRPAPPRVMDTIEHTMLIRPDNDIHGL